MKRNALLLALLLLVPAAAQAQVTITYTFVNGTAANADHVNANFSALASQALNRTGGVLTGNLTVNPGVTIDGYDLSTALLGLGTSAADILALQVAVAGKYGLNASPTFVAMSTDTITVGSLATTSIYTAGGITAGSTPVLVANAAGKLPAFNAGNYVSLDGSNLLNLNASQVGGAAHLTTLIVDGNVDTGGAGTITAGFIVSANTIQAQTTVRALGGYLSSDGSAGVTYNCTNFTAFGAYITVKNGLVTGVSC